MSKNIQEYLYLGIYLTNMMIYIYLNSRIQIIVYLINSYDGLLASMF